MNLKSCPFQGLRHQVSIYKKNIRIYTLSQFWGTALLWGFFGFLFLNHGWKEGCILSLKTRWKAKTTSLTFLRVEHQCESGGPNLQLMSTWYNEKKIILPNWGVTSPLIHSSRHRVNKIFCVAFFWKVVFKTTFLLFCIVEILWFAF